MLEQHRGQPASLVRVVDDERDLGGVGARHPVVAADREEVVAEHRDERDPVVVVDVGEPLHLRGDSRGWGAK